MFNSQCLNVVLLFIYSLSARMCGSQGHFENTMKYARIKDLCIETCFSKRTDVANSQEEQKPHKLHMKSIKTRQEGKRATSKTSARTLRAGELKNSQSGTWFAYFKKVSSEHNKK